jgi:hypothetical protein
VSTHGAIPDSVEKNLPLRPNGCLIMREELSY